MAKMACIIKSGLLGNFLNGETRRGEKIGSLVHSNCPDVLLEVSSCCPDNDPLNLPFTVIKEGGQFRKSNCVEVLLHVLDNEDHIFIVQIFMCSGDGYIFIMFSEEQYKKSGEQRIQHAVFVSAEMDEFIIDIFSNCLQLRVPRCVKKQIRRLRRLIEGSCKKSAQKIIVWDEAQKMRFKSGHSNQNIQHDPMGIFCENSVFGTGGAIIRISPLKV